MLNFWDFNVWGMFNLIATLLLSLLVANTLKRKIRFLKDSLIPISVLGGALLIIVAWIYKLITGNVMFDTKFFGGNGTAELEIITYHCLALGFIASTFRKSEGKVTKERAGEVLNTGVTTVATYVLQGIVGIVITLVATIFVKDFFPAAGAILPFGYGQGTGQALNYGTIYETDYGFVGGRTFGLTIAALGFISAAVGGIIHLAYLKAKGYACNRGEDKRLNSIEIEAENEIPMQESMDKLTVQVALIALAYFMTYLIMAGLGKLIPSMKSLIYGFNFLLGVLSTIIIKAIMNFLHKKKIMKREYTNNFLMTRTSNFFYDVMIVSGVAAIRLNELKKYWGILLILGVAGFVITFVYNRFVAKKLFPDYAEEQFMVMFGMLTGTASTGIILLREIDGDFKTPAADNLVYQNFPAIVLGFPMMIVATMAPKNPPLTIGVLVVYFIILNVILFRKQIFKRKKK